MEKIKQAFTGKSAEERAEHGGTGMGTASTQRGATGTEYTGGAAGGPAYGTAGTGTESYSTETETRTGTVEVPIVQQTTTTTGTASVAAQGGEAVCAQEYFTKTEDRPIVKERVEYIQEHRPVEKEFVVETRATGVEREVAEGRHVEHLGTTERIVAVAPPKAPCE